MTDTRPRRRRASAAPKRNSSQINIRVSPDVEQVLEAAAFVRKYRSLQQLLAPVVIEHAAKLANEEAVKVALRARERQDAQDA